MKTAKIAILIICMNSNLFLQAGIGTKIRGILDSSKSDSTHSSPEIPLSVLAQCDGKKPLIYYFDSEKGDDKQKPK